MSNKLFHLETLKTTLEYIEYLRKKRITDNKNPKKHEELIYDLEELVKYIKE